MLQVEKIVKRYKNLLQSVAIFPSWLLMIYSGMFFVPALFLFSTPEIVLSISTAITFASLFVVGFFTVREKARCFVGWAAITIALGILLFSIPNGLQLIYLFFAAGIITAASYYGFAYSQKLFSPTVLIMGIFFLIVFVSHVVILSVPRQFGLNVQGNELSIFAMEALQQEAKMDPVEFVKTKKGREIAVQLYNTSIFISQEELENMVRENPGPIKETQSSLLSTENSFTDNPYSYILSIYTHSLINFSRKK